MPFNASIRRKFATIAFKSLQHHGVDYLHNCNDRRAWTFSLSPIFLKFFGKISVFFGLRIKFHNSCKPWVRRMPKIRSSTHNSICCSTIFMQEINFQSLMVTVKQFSMSRWMHNSCTFNKKPNLLPWLVADASHKSLQVLQPLQERTFSGSNQGSRHTGSRDQLHDTVLYLHNNQLTFSTVHCVYIAYGLPNCLPCSLQQKSLIVLSGLSRLRVVQLGSRH